MSGDINLRINKRIGILIACLMGAMATAEYVSVIDAKSAGGVIVSKPEHTVGSVVFRMDDTNPSEIYGGTWELITADASVRFGDGSMMTGAVEGLNQVPVPLVSHAHSKGTMDITGQFALGGSGGLRIMSTATSGSFYSGGNSSVDGYGGGARTGNSLTYFKASRSWTGVTSYEGESSPTMDVRGAYIKLNVWKKTG